MPQLQGLLPGQPGPEPPLILLHVGRPGLFLLLRVCPHLLREHAFRGGIGAFLVVPGSGNHAFRNPGIIVLLKLRQACQVRDVLPVLLRRQGPRVVHGDVPEPDEAVPHRRFKFPAGGRNFRLSLRPGTAAPGPAVQQPHQGKPAGKGILPADGLQLPAPLGRGGIRGEGTHILPDGSHIPVQQVQNISARFPGIAFVHVISSPFFFCTDYSISRPRLQCARGIISSPDIREELILPCHCGIFSKI